MLAMSRLRKLLPVGELESPQANQLKIWDTTARKEPASAEFRQDCLRQGTLLLTAMKSASQVSIMTPVSRGSTRCSKKTWYAVIKMLKIM